jgi:hypothetical protein
LVKRLTRVVVFCCIVLPLEVLLLLLRGTPPVIGRKLFVCI